MESIKSEKFQKLSEEEASKIIGGKKVLHHDSCTGSADGPVSKTLIGYGWIGQNIFGHDAVEEEYDDAYGC